MVAPASTFVRTKALGIEVVRGTRPRGEHAMGTEGQAAQKLWRRFVRPERTCWMETGGFGNARTVSFGTRRMTATVAQLARVLSETLARRAFITDGSLRQRSFSRRARSAPGPTSTARAVKTRRPALNI